MNIAKDLTPASFESAGDDCSAVGHYGSGKTFVAVNYAIALKKVGKQVSIYDLDIVNPYFRTVDALKTLEKEGVEDVRISYGTTVKEIKEVSRSFKEAKMAMDVTLPAPETATTLPPRVWPLHFSISWVRYRTP